MNEGAPARPIAFYLPQYHPIPENDEWWEPGFTEWTNVAKARPLFAGHQQPRLPGELGFYDLRVPEVRERQAALAQEYGIEGFCYWHYWFAGRQLLERPFEEVLNSGRPGLKFCVGWANESWTGRWHGLDSKVLVAQTYPGKDDHRRHFDYLRPAFEDDRYIRVDNRPLLFVYRPGEFPDSRAFVEQWQEMAIEAGLDGLYLVGGTLTAAEIGPSGFDAGTDEPRRELGAWSRWRRYLAKPPGAVIRGGPAVHDYEAIVRADRAPVQASQPVYPVALSNWDNTPRSGRRGLVLRGSTPEAFEIVLRKSIRSVESLPPDQRILFIKSWNEWAEGNYLEPDSLDGRARLAAVRRALDREAAHLNG